MKIIRNLNLSLFLLASFAAAQVQAQAAAGDGGAEVEEATKANRTSRLLEEVVVTAQKREENLQDVPISMQAFGEEALDALGITDTSDLQFVTPTLNVSAVVGFTSIYLRGVGTDAFLTADPSVATYIDGIYLPVAAGVAQDFGVIERIEVLKGPQGTLFGRNTNGGALNIMTRDPLLGEFDAQVNLTVATYPDLYAKAYINIPIGDTFAVSMSPVYGKTQHYIKNTAADPVGPMNDDESEGYRIKARWAPFDWVDMTVAALTINSDTPGALVQPTIQPTTIGQAIGIAGNNYQRGDKETELDHCCGSLVDNEMLYGNIKFYTPWFDIKLLASDQQIRTTTIIDFDGSARNGIGLTNTGFSGDIQTAELQLVSNADSWGSDWFRWIVGAYKFEGLTGYLEPGDRLELHANLLDPLLSPVNSILSLVDSLGLGLLPAELNSGLLFATNLVATTSESVFAQATFTLADWLDLTLGVRHQDEGRELLDSKLGLLVSGDELTLFDYDYAVTQTGERVGTKRSTVTTSPKVSLEMRPFDEETLVYLSYQEATKSGTYNGFAVTGPPTYAEPESIAAWELGLKTSFLQGTLLFNAAIFDYEIENQQVQFVSLTTGGSISFENAELANIRGFDFDVTWVIAPHLIDGLVLVGGAGWLETAEFTSYPNAKGYTNNSGITSQDQDFSGNRIPKTPEISGNLALSKTWFFDRGELEMAADMYYSEEYFYEPSNREESFEPSYTLWGARLSYLYEPWNTRLTLFGRNLTDANPTRGAIGEEFGRQVIPGEPTTYGLRLAWKY
ncbi:TonB-dependent receptor [Zhongshania arctica]|uniref:TonB-dependent receptor n=1 Tax=Zhongshania arctica TaxID=3238302 RepID=A0ABV3TZN0_9GAMM